MLTFGYACKTIGVPGTEQRTLTLARASEANLTEVVGHNLAALSLACRYCHAQGIELFRISSDIVPLGSHPSVNFDWQYGFRAELQELGTLIRSLGLQVSMHPGQYTVLNSPRPDVLEHSVADLVYHAAFLDALGLDASARLILHIGGAYGDKPSALARFRENAAQLPPAVLRRLSLENDERIFNIEEVLEVCEELSLPAVFDVFHHSLNPPKGRECSHSLLKSGKGGPKPHPEPEPDVSSGYAACDADYWLDRCAATWTDETGPQKIHYSQQEAGGKPGSHSQTIWMDDFMRFQAWLGGRELDVMLEVKDKNLSAIKCANLAASKLPRRRLTEEWARYKYYVLERGQARYNRIRELLKSERPDSKQFYQFIEEAEWDEIRPGAALNAAQHVWGYLDKLATPAEAKRIFKQMDKLQEDISALPGLKRCLLALAQKHQVEYLLQSLYFYI